mmetsp:Transcript_39935/g.113249  ORF Transcript_39935/g.113249 Transcript_39935/m.113249 type:complete len:269 (+) Transcript_39935:206-1012(+)|eukprot:CAMPEP_0117665620 /NCGR_PEP_ID=MMETSP0804-20121206/9915_1 /TAXON_ID=1074897 /ORGANISM="Tetraselmis astigmatica, Strain CCMP880" /LENGTH=268 /DNA_ID=CAMNT_0005473061 /DNA_START=191 /DNA_END=997 /DNA_ORIENTATION=+
MGPLAGSAAAVTGLLAVPSPALANRLHIPSIHGAWRALPLGYRRRACDNVGRVMPSIRAQASSDDSPNPWAEPGFKGAAVSQLPESSQVAVVAGIFCALGVGTALSCTAIGPFIAEALPGFFAFSKATWPLLGVTYLAAGVAHFTAEKGFLAMYPHRGAWGIFYLPGSASFHVRWTGVAEFLGGAGLLLGAYLPGGLLLSSDLEHWSALGLSALTWAVTPANIYMFTHNAPGPLPDGVDVPTLTWQGHLARGVLQVLLLSILWGLADS